MQGKENLPTTDTITVFNDEEIAKLKEECFRTWGTGKRMYQQAAAYIFMLNTGLRAGEVLGLLNSDIDLENRVVHIQRRVKEVQRRDGVEQLTGIEQKGLHSLRHTFATNLVNGIKQPDGSIKSLTPRQVADLLGHSTSEITEMYYVKRDTSRLIGITDNFEM